MSGSDDLPAIAEDLYAGSPDDFVARRTEQVKIARTAKDRELATAIGKLRRPTRSAWLVNLLARGASTELAELLEVGVQLQQAQQRQDGARLRELSTQRRRGVDQLVRRAVSLAADQGYDAPESARQEIAQTLQAALADQAVGEAVRRGVLAEAMTYGGFGPLGPDLSLVPPAPEPAVPAAESDDTDADAERAAALERATAALAEAERELGEAEERAGAATSEADDRAEEVERLTEQLATARDAAALADKQARAARKELEQRRSEVEQARRQLAESSATE